MVNDVQTFVLLRVKVFLILQEIPNTSCKLRALRAGHIFLYTKNAYKVIDSERSLSWLSTKKVDTDLKFVDREKEVEKFWNEEDIFKEKYGEP